jgi:hypothetical protein
MRPSRFCSPTSALLCTTLASLCFSACVTEDVDPAAVGAGGTSGGELSAGSSGAAGMGGTGSAGTAAGGSAGATGAGGLSSDPAFGVATACPAPTQASITDFSPLALGVDAGAADAGAAIADITFGDFTSTFSGGTFVYPNAAGDPYVVTSDMSSGEWHMSGNIGNYSGFGLYFSGCNRIDASAYAGISFTVRGNVAMGNSISFQVSTSADEISHLYLNSQAMPPNPPSAANSGRCLPVMNQYDGTCATPSFSVQVSTSEATIEVRWSDFSGGAPEAAVDPTEITGIRWILPNPVGAGTATPTPYAADFYIDDLSFIESP